jgi:two-component system OmpR family sensor kinase
MDRGTLSRQLIIRVASLVALVAVALDVFCVFALHRILVENLDNQLVSARQLPPGGPARRDGFQPWSDSIQITIIDDTIYWQIVAKGQFVDQDDNQIQRLVDDLHKADDGHPTTVDLGKLGSYRVLRTMSVEGPSQVVENIFGLPMEGVDDAIRDMVAILVVLTITAVIIAALISGAVVQDSLRPLNRMAATATKVANMTLDKGEVDLHTRLPEQATNPASEVGRVGMAFNRMLDNVDDALQSRQRAETKVRQFVADASHELRNPLASIRGYAELASRDAEALPEQAAFAISRISAESKRMSNLVEDMLMLARLDNGPNVNIAPVDIVESILNSVSDAQVAGPDHSWNLDLPDEPVVVNGDKNQLAEIWVNLLSNARKHTPPGTAVTVRVTTEPKNAVVVITDNGPGIPPSLCGQVFERFARADVARTHDAEGSTGLGLAIVAAVVKAHHGNISVNSTPGNTVFTVRLPLAE